MAVVRGAPARHVDVRARNLAVVLAAAVERAPCSRAQLAAATGLTKATVSSLVDTLVGGGLLLEPGPQAAPGRVGRPGSSLVPSPHGPVGVGLEIDVDRLAVCAVDLAGRVRARHVVPGDLRGVDVGEVLRRAGGAVAAVLRAAREEGLPVAGLAVAAPGLVDGGPGRPRLLRTAPNLGWRDVDVLAGVLAAARDAPDPRRCHLDNEANLAALGELWCGRGTAADGGPLRTFLFVSGEIGIGAGIVVDGVLWRGQRGFAGEIGHVDGLEARAGQEAVLAAAGADGTEDLLRRAGAGDARAMAAVRAAGGSLGAAVAAAVTLVDVDTVVLGGLYARLAPWLLDPVEAELARRVLPAARPVRVLASALGPDAAMLGAATSVVREVLDDPAGYLRDRPA
jgi:predicted NBD/HSP70 family sugar kinase